MEGIDGIAEIANGTKQAASYNTSLEDILDQVLFIAPLDRVEGAICSTKAS